MGGDSTVVIGDSPIYHFAGRRHIRGMRKATSKQRTTLLGSCQCGKVHFSVESETPVPFMFCFCSICRKTGGAAFGLQHHGHPRHHDGQG